MLHHKANTKRNTHADGTDHVDHVCTLGSPRGMHTRHHKGKIILRDRIFVRNVPIKVRG